MLGKLSGYLARPELYAPSTGKFWDDEHISKGMLQAHLTPDWDAATRKLDFVGRSAEWIASVAPPARFPRLLDLGCGPGIYAERFCRAGYSVTGIDLSRRSIEYAIGQAKVHQSDIRYTCQDYLTIDFESRFDVATLIYCDFGALSTANRRILLKKIHRALKPEGKLILDAFTPALYAAKTERRSWQYNGAGGFWSDKPHLCLDSVYHYDEDTTELRQSVIVTEESVSCYNIWEHFFSKEALSSETGAAGFRAPVFYGDIAGKAYSEAGDTLCGVFTK